MDFTPENLRENTGNLLGIRERLFPALSRYVPARGRDDLLAGARGLERH